MSYLIKKLSSKREIDDVVRSTEDLVLVLRFGRDSDLTCMQLDEIVSCCNLRHRFHVVCVMLRVLVSIQTI